MRLPAFPSSLRRAMPPAETSPWLRPRRLHTGSPYVIPPDRHRLRGTPGALPPVSLSRDGVPHVFPPDRIRNVSLVAHVDHGKTTLTDALLRWCGLLPAEEATGTFTDRLSVEKARGITIKAQTCSVLIERPHPTEPLRRETYLLNLIDTPGHVDFQYEVTRSLGASEGVALLVDVVQGVEAQTMAQYHAALEHHLALVPVLTKLDGVRTEDQVEGALQCLEDCTGVLRHEVLLTSAKKKEGLEDLLEALIDRVPAPLGQAGFSALTQLPVMHPASEERRQAEARLVPLRALLFDCWTSSHGGLPGTGARARDGAAEAHRRGATAETGVYGLVRVVDGTLTAGLTITLAHAQQRYEVGEVGLLHPELLPAAALTAGMVGYVFLPGVPRREVWIGDTLCTLPTPRHRVGHEGAARGREERVSGEGPAWVPPIPGFRRAQPVVFAGFYPDEGDYITHLRGAVDQLRLNDPSVTVEAVQCPALGAGLQLGFLGLLHLQVFKERLLAEFGQATLVTPPQVQYLAVGQHEDPDDPRHRTPLTTHNWRWPHEGIGTYLEPFVMATVVTPKDAFHAIHAAAIARFRGEQEDLRVVDDARMVVRYRMPLADLARGFFSLVKSASHGYATLDYDDPVYVAADLVKVDIVIHKATISALAVICPRAEATEQGRRILASLKENLPRSIVDLPLQALIGRKIIARETIKAYRKDVTAKIHAGDISRKQKKWNDQQKGKERLARRTVGSVTLDQSVLAAAMGATIMR